MSVITEGKSNMNQFIEYLNEILSAENAIVERLNRRIIQKIHFQETKNTLQDELDEEINHQNKLRNLISEYGGKPTNTKAKLLSLDSGTNDITDYNSFEKIESTLTQSDSNHKVNNHNQMQIEILRIREDAMIKSAEIIGYKMILKIAKKIKAKKAIDILKKNLEEKESIYNKLIDLSSKVDNKIEEDDDYNKKNHQHKESFRLGSTIADILTSYWNSKENPSKVYIFDRRVHHGAIGALLGLSDLYKKQPIITGILSGLGAGLAEDDYKDFKEWFLFKKKEED